MYLKKINLKNKTALGTGAGKGIGKACAIALAEAGADLIGGMLSGNMTAGGAIDTIKKGGKDFLIENSILINDIDGVTTVR